MAKKGSRKRSGPKVVNKNSASVDKKGLEFHGVGAETYNKEMEKRREESKVKPASFPVVSRDDAVVKGDPARSATGPGIGGWNGEGPHYFPADAHEPHGTDEFKPLTGVESAPAPAPETAPAAEEAPRRRGRPPVAVKKRQYTLTLHPDMYDQATAEAQKRGISFSALVTLAIKEYLAK